MHTVWWVREHETRSNREFCLFVISSYVCNQKEEASYNREKRILFPTKLQNIDALKRSRKHSRKPENVLLLCIIFGLSFHPINYHRQVLCFYYRMLENYSEISVSLVKSCFRNCYLSSLFGLSLDQTSFVKAELYSGRFTIVFPTALIWLHSPKWTFPQSVSFFCIIRLPQNRHTSTSGPSHPSFE